MKKRIMGLFLVVLLLAMVCAPAASFAIGADRVIARGETVQESLSSGKNPKYYYVYSPGLGTLNVNFKTTVKGDSGWAVDVYQVYNDANTKVVNRNIFSVSQMGALDDQTFRVPVKKALYQIRISKSANRTAPQSNPYRICPTFTEGAAAVSGVALDQKALTMKQGTKQALAATVSPENTANKKVTWKTSNKKVATVSSSGLVTAKATGKAVITATTASGKKTAKCTVTVKAKVAGVKLSKKVVTIRKGRIVKLKASVSPANAISKKVTWKTSKPKTASVTQKGVVKGLKRGTAKITVVTEDGRKRATCVVTVK